MTTLSDFRSRVRQVLFDSGSAIWPDASLDEALRQALAEYSQVMPQMKVSVLTLPASGREIDLSSLGPLLFVSRVWWPYDESRPTWPPNQVKGWQLYFDQTTPILFLDALDGGQPQAGDQVRLWYATPHTLSGLDGATSTSLPGLHEALLVSGAAGHAAMSRALDLSESTSADLFGVGLIGTWASRKLREFREKLESLRRASARSGQAWGQAWRLDPWDD